MTRNKTFRMCKAQMNREYNFYEFKNKIEAAYINGVNIDLIRSAIMASSLNENEKNSLLKEFQKP